MTNSKREKISGLWAGEWKNQNGETVRYLSGKNDGIKYSIWPNGFKSKENDPTHVLYRESVEDQAPKPIKKEDLPF